MRDASTGDAADVAVTACEVPAARMGDSAAARAFFESPARCGQTPFRMVSDARLGVPDGVGMQNTFLASVLRAVASGAGVTLPTPFRYDVAVDQVSYATQDRGQIVPATTLVAYPTNPDERTNFEVLLFLHGTTGFNDACAPSLMSDQRALVAALASTGYVVVAPDYVGLRGFGGASAFPHPYLVGATTAVSCLDGLRAGIRHVASRGIDSCARPRFVTIGGSQGGHAALWVDRIAGHYAPELELMGTVATVPPADFEAEAVRGLQMTVQATAGLMAFFTAAAPWYGLDGRLGEVFLPPYTTSLPAALAANCSPTDAVRGVTREMVFTQRALDAGASRDTLRAFAPWGCLVSENGVPSATVPRAVNTHPGNGILWVSGEQDQLVNTPLERSAFTSLCAAGYSMQYLECAGASHTQTTGWALPEIIEFAQARFAGTALDAATACRVNAPVRCRATPMR